MNETTHDPYAYWRAGLAGLLSSTQDGNPQAGFYRMRKVRGGPWLPVAIWIEEGGDIACLRGVDEAIEARNVWLACARFPVSEDYYRHCIEHGSWPGALPETDDGPPPIGDNNPPADPAHAIPATVSELVAQAQKWRAGRTIGSQAESDRAEALIAGIAGVQKQAEAQHKVEKAPHLEAGRKVDSRWKAIIDSAVAEVRSLKAALTPYLNARAAEKKAEAAKAIAQGAQVTRADIRPTTSGVHGRKVSLRTRKRAVIKDYPAALAFFADHPEVKELIQRLADKVAGIDGTVPGVEVVTEQVAA